MARLPKLVQLPLYLALACLAAGLFGMIHNQVSYTLGPEYFHKYKFIQFGVIQDFPPRLAASMVGWQASWWMGLVIGVPLFLLALPAPDRASYARLCRIGFVTVIGTVLVLDAVAIAAGYAFLSVDILPPRFTGRVLTDPLAFARAGFLHDASYLGGLVGLCIAVFRIIVRLRRARQP